MNDKIKKACEYLTTKAYLTYDKKKCGKCATFVRCAVDFGFDCFIDRTESAKNYGPSYEKIGFKKVFSYPDIDKKKTDYIEQIGDIAIIDYEPHGHICMRTPKGWYSDFKQIDLYGGVIRLEDPKFAIYRYVTNNA